MLICADLRWPDKTGIGVVKNEMLKRKPVEHAVEDLGVTTRIGSPWSPFALALALRRGSRARRLFWNPGFIPAAAADVPMVVTVHDLLHLHFYSRFHVAYYDWVFRPLYQKCRAVITVSNFSRNEFLEWSGFPPERCHAVHLGVSSQFGAPPADTQPPFAFPYVLYPGNRRIYKNIPRLLAAYGASRLARDGVKLVLTGNRDAATEEQARKLGLTEQVVYAGVVDDTTLVQLYRHAVLIAFVSLYEGFGLPIVEGMAAGVPVLTSNTSSMAEVAENAALVVDPYSVDAIAAGLERLTFDSTARTTYVDRGRERAKTFDWQVTAAKTWAILEAAGQA